MKLSTGTLPNIFFAAALTLTSTAILAEPNDALEVKASQVESQQKIVNINKSTLNELLTLKGIGEKKAQAILAYRKLSGGFKTIEELKDIKGIGNKIIDDNKLRLTI
ncbi:MAG: helix-hairpin-helix domain-containing protein [Colwellia sp.]